MSTGCANHPRSQAVYQCRECGRPLCSVCTTVRDVGSTTVRACGACGGPVALLHPDELSFSAIAGQVLSSVFSRHGVLVLAAGGAICGLISSAAIYNIIPLINLLVYGLLWGILSAYICLVINHASSGEFEMPMIGDVADWWDDLLLPAVRLAVAYSTVVVPMLIYAIWFKRWNIGPGATPETIAAALLDPLLLAFGLFGLLYMPMATMVAAIERSALAALNPLLVLTLIFRAPAGYLLALLLFYAIQLAGGVLGALLGVIFGRTSMVIVPEILGWTIDFLVWYLAASTLGGLAFKFGDRFGMAPIRRPGHPHGRDLSHLPQIAPGAAAPGASPVATAAPASPAATTPGPWEPPAAPRTARTPIELPPEPAAKLSAPEAGMPLEGNAATAPPAAVPAAAPVPDTFAPMAGPDALLAMGDLDGACDAYLLQLRSDPRAMLPADALMTVAQRLQAREQYAEAVAAYRKLGALYGDHPQAADALLQAAFVVFRQLGQRQDAIQILEFLLSRYPGAAAAAQAEQILSALRPQT